MTELIKKRLKKLPDDVIIMDDDIIINTLKTEDLGKIFEMAICLLYEIPFDGKYKYSMEESNIIKTRIQPLLTAFPAQDFINPGKLIYT